MGHRCNYATRQNGEVTVYYSHWGALSIARDFFWGLDRSLEFLSMQHESDDDMWLDDVFGEGGAAVDLDTRTLTISGGEIYDHARELLVELAQAIWAHDDFTVRDVESIVDVAVAVGVDPDKVEAAHLPWKVLDVADDAMTGRASGHFSTLAIVDGEVHLAGNSDGLLELGAARLGELAKLPDLDEARRLWEELPAPSWEDVKRPLGERVRDIIVIDSSARRLEAPRWPLRSRKSRRHFAALWPDWELVGYADPRTIRSRLALPEFAPAPETPPLPLADQLAKIERYLFRSSEDLGAWFADLAAKHMEPGGWVNPDAVRPTFDGRPDDAIDANERFRAALAEVIARRNAASK